MARSVADLRLGFVGGGRHATANLYPSIALAGGCVTAVATRHADGAAALAGRVGAERSHDSYEAMLAPGDLDAVFVSVDPADHAPIAEACLLAGVDVFVEKPLGLTVAEATRVADVADEVDQLAMVAFMKRFAPAYVLARDLLADRERFGDVTGFRATFAFSPWTSELRDDTFLLYAAIHMVDLVRSLVGEVVDVAGFRRSNGADITMAYALRTVDGVVGTMDLASLPSWGRGHEELTVHGTRGYLTVTDQREVRHHLEAGRVDDPARWQALDEATTVVTPAVSTGSGGLADLYLRGFVGEVAHFLDCVLTRRAPVCSARDNVATTLLCRRLLGAR